jgi:hypothetical protein
MKPLSTIHAGEHLTGKYIELTCIARSGRATWYSADALSSAPQDQRQDSRILKD